MLKLDSGVGLVLSVALEMAGGVKLGFSSSLVGAGPVSGVSSSGVTPAFVNLRTLQSSLLGSADALITDFLTCSHRIEKQKQAHRAVVMSYSHLLLCRDRDDGSLRGLSLCGMERQKSYTIVKVS